MTTEMQADVDSLPAGTWNLDPVHSRVDFEVRIDRLRNGNHVELGR